MIDAQDNSGLRLVIKHGIEKPDSSEPIFVKFAAKIQTCSSHFTMIYDLRVSVYKVPYFFFYYFFSFVCRKVNLLTFSFIFFVLHLVHNGLYIASVGYVYPNVGFLKKILGFEQGFEVF